MLPGATAGGRYSDALTCLCGTSTRYRRVKRVYIYNASSARRTLQAAMVALESGDKINNHSVKLTQ